MAASKSDTGTEITTCRSYSNGVEGLGRCLLAHEVAPFASGVSVIMHRFYTK